MNTALIGTCEHAGNRVPARYRVLFKPHAHLLTTHRGYDIGIHGVARRVCHKLGIPLLPHFITRLLVETNRSRHHPRLFSEITRVLPAPEKQQIIDTYYTPHRQRVETTIRETLHHHPRMLHIGFHSFTPALDGVVREVDIGLLYDPSRPAEVTACRAIKTALTTMHPGYRIRMNHPYRGTSDGLTTTLRRLWPDPLYGGIEIEINQRLLQTTTAQTSLANTLIQAITTGRIPDSLTSPFGIRSRSLPRSQRRN